jgi:hypothetical protein
MVIALAGRRVDPPDALQKRFPADNVHQVQQQIRDALVKLRATALVCSAACGADILALELAGELGMCRRVILPFDKEDFVRSSVTDRPGDWEIRLRPIFSDVEAKGELIVYDYNKGEEETYFATNHDILDNAEEIAQDYGDDLIVMVVWDGESRGESDVTGHFLEEAKRRRMRVVEISTV